MATLRPHKQLSLLLLASTSPWIPRALSTLSGGNSLGTPSFCRPLPRHPTPYPPPRPGSAHSRPEAARGAQGRAEAGALGPAVRPGHRTLAPPPTCPCCSPASSAPGTQPGARGPRPGAGSDSGTVCRGFHVLSSGLRVAPPHVSAACPCLPTQSVCSRARGQVRLSDATCRSGPRNWPHRNDLRHTKAGRVIQFPGKRLPPHP